MEHKHGYNEMLLECEEKGERISPGSIRPRGRDYISLLKDLESYKTREKCPHHFAPSDTFFLINNQNKILGAVCIRHCLNEELLKFGGHIGYGIRPSERKKGYATIMLRMALEKCWTMGIDKVLVTCNKDNIPSAKTILANGGILENELMEDNGNIVQRYWIEL